MSEPTTDDLKNAFEIATQIGTSRLQFCLNGSLNWCKRKIGVEAYNQVFGSDASTLLDSAYLDENITTTDEVALRLAEVTAAVLNYAMANLVQNANLRIRSSGQVKREQDAGSPAAGAGMQIQNEYLSPKEALEWADRLMATANRLLGPYMIEQEPTNPWAWGRTARA